MHKRCKKPKCRFLCNFGIKAVRNHNTGTKLIIQQNLANEECCSRAATASPKLVKGKISSTLIDKRKTRKCDVIILKFDWLPGDR